MSDASLFKGIKPSPVFLGILGVTFAGGVMAWVSESHSVTAKIGAFVLVLGGWVTSLCLHEFGHAFAAWRAGDHNMALKGYLDLDVRRYADPINSLVIPLFIILIGGIGLPGGAVYLDTRWMTKKQRTIISLAGPLANLIVGALLLIVGTVGIGDGLQIRGDGFGHYVLGDSEHLAFWSATQFLGYLQIFALVINLLPIPGLDGYGAVEPWLSVETQQKLEPVRRWGFIALFMVLLIPNPLGDFIRSIVLHIFTALGGNVFLVGMGIRIALPWQ